MRTGKQLKNVYTILEKVKKGEIQSHYKDRDGLFGKIKFYKKADLIKPHIHYIDESRIDRIVRDELKDVATIQKYFSTHVKKDIDGKLKKSKKGGTSPDLSAFVNKVTEVYDKLPESLKYDIQKTYYHRIENLEFEQRTDKNLARYRLIEKANNPVAKIMTQGSNLKSAVFTKKMMLYYAMQLAGLSFTSPEDYEDMMNQLGGDDGDGNGQQNGQGSSPGKNPDDILQDMMDGSSSKQLLDEMLKDAQDTCKMLDDHIDQDLQEKIFDEPQRSLGGGSAGALSPDYLRKVAAQLENVKMSMGSLKNNLQKILDKSKSYFSAKKVVIYDDFLNAQDVSGLEEYELLHPNLRKIFVEDIMVKEYKHFGKLDVYIDISGSMSGGCGVKNQNGANISKMEFAKSLAAKLKEMGILNKIFLFNNRVYPCKNDMISIAMIDCDGGTTTDNAVRNIIREDTNAIVITDAEDSCNTYSEKAFFIGVQGAHFSGFNERYMQQDQCIVFDGTNIYKVDNNGSAIKPKKN